MFVHLAFLNGFGNRISTWLRWVRWLVGHRRAERVFSVAHTGGDLSTPASVLALIEPNPYPAVSGPSPSSADERPVLSGLVQPILAVNPVPWARAQMAFTLAFHIILVPLGVSWAFMTLIANYRGIKHGDADALLLAQRWSKYMAVTFAVGAVTGTVLSFEFGLLWPRFMGQWGEAFGVPFAFEGLFFFTEAIFVAIYIFGWQRLKPWAHFWTGVPIVITGIVGSVSVVAANAWMNAPSGFTLNDAGKVVDVDPLAVIFNDAMPLMAAHMVRRGVRRRRVPRRLGVRGRHAAGPPRPLPPARLPHRVQRRRRSPRRSRWASATRWPAGSTTTSRSSSPPSSSCRRRRATSPRRCFGHLNDDGTVTGGIRIPGLASILSDPERRHGAP